MDIHFDDLHYKKRKFNWFDAYCETKLANFLYAKELAKRLKGTGVTVVSVHPGWARSNLAGSGPISWIMNYGLRPFAKPLTLLSNDDSAQSSLHCLLDDDVVNHPGEYYSQATVMYSDKACRAGGWPMASPNPNANNLEKAKQLVEVSRELVGI